ncbi:MAG TPA: hypothetical protein VF173_26020 [Thermoanaerobaculia bacterium]|nr:hypothetical protein [Thermoanaerobaculia bacterium]
MEDKDKVLILLAEYNALRDELLAARAAATNAAGIGIPILMAAIGLYLTSVTNPGFRYVIIAVAVLAVLGICFFVGWNEVNTRNFAARLRDIETDINTRAGERLLIWENDYGWGALVTGRRRAATPKA